MELDSRVAKFYSSEIMLMLAMLIVRGIVNKVVLRMNKMPHIALNHVVTLWVVWLKNCIIVSLQRYPKVQIIYFAHRAVTLWVVGIST